ncbi:uncharacterized protein LOC126586889 isoform X1 [Malus sylvestris]|uniref:uncharacterized protein LOC126586889 isoform X1 n=2 Tax=Malus sylvestris TaxID=3752 RepID=UPI0021AC0101|nr:uncharacterized protein LOC126586889 isoform X1 [Malus sylvestris]
MEEETQSVGIEGGHEGGDEFYEKIQAPKFVDFTESDPHRPDDRYWFCMRVGCDQKHEVELDSEAIYKNFILRVMAARSPNVKLRKALARKAPSLKCPLTAPAKSSKPRVSRLALISSFSHKMADTENRARKPLHKICATPNVKAKKPTAVSKALTTQRNQKPVSNSETFQSVRNPKLKNIVVPKNRPVAKALVFHSPKKPVRTKASMERSSPVGKICSAMKKLEITSGKKHVLGYNKPLPLDTSRKQFRGREVKSRVFDSLRSNNCKGQEAKSSKRKNMEKDLKQHYDPAPREEVDDNDSSDMEVDKKSRKGTLEGFSMSATSQSGRLNGENQVEILSETLNGDTTSLSGSEERDSKENYNKENANNGNGYEEKTKLRSEKRNTLEQVDDDDDKENNTASDENRELNINDHSKRINLGKHDASKKLQKVNQADKIPKERSTSAASNDQGVKYRKPKPTNPKPFRFRTDERGMLKEATSEKKVHALLKEITLVGTPGAKSTSKHQNVIQITKNCLGQSERENDTQGHCEKRSDRRTRLEENGMKGATCLKTPKADFERKASVVTPLRRKVSTYEKERASPERVHKSKERTISPMVQQRSVTRRGVGSSRKKAVVSSRTPCQLSVIKETSSRKIRPKKGSASSPATKGSASSPSRSLSRGRRPTTVPKNDSLDVPKACAGLHKENDSLDEQQN